MRSRSLLTSAEYTRHRGRESRDSRRADRAINGLGETIMGASSGHMVQVCLEQYAIFNGVQIRAVGNLSTARNFEAGGKKLLLT